jgi:hypothetical protein
MTKSLSKRNSNDYLIKETNNIFGNIKFLCSGNFMINTKMIGLYITTIIIFLTTGLTIYLTY